MAKKSQTTHLNPLTGAKLQGENMKKLFLAVLCVCVCVALVVPAFAGQGNGNGNGNNGGQIVVNQNQSQGVFQTQASVGGYSLSSQRYVTGAEQAYVIQKSGNPSGIAGAATGSATSGSQIKFGNGFQMQGMIGGATNNGGLYW